MIPRVLRDGMSNAECSREASLSPAGRAVRELDGDLVAGARVSREQGAASSQISPAAVYVFGPGIDGSTGRLRARVDDLRTEPPAPGDHDRRRSHDFV